MSDTFEYHGVELAYFDHMYNLTWFNERRVELAVAYHWLRGKAWMLGIEVGNVLGHYQEHNHVVIDRYEEAAWYQRLQHVINADLFDVGPEKHAPWVISISTIEHTDDPIKAVEILRDMVNPGGQLLVTFPTGVNDELDELIQWCDQTFTRWCTLSRDGDGWRQDDSPVVSPYGPWANSVAICEWEASS